MIQYSFTPESNISLTSRDNCLQFIMDSFSEYYFDSYQICLLNNTLEKTLNVVSQIHAISKDHKICSRFFTVTQQNMSYIPYQ